MRLIHGVNNIDSMLKMYKAVRRGYEIETRGAKCRNVHDMAIILDAKTSVITSFRERKLNLKYAKKEWLWYLTADPMDDSILQHATAWAKLRQPSGEFFSNYGQYLFSIAHGQSQFAYVAKTLKADPQSRRASMVLLRQEHLFPENSDTVCTYAINFTIEGHALNMTVMMRSNDVIWGFTNDAFCFSQVYEFMYQVLKHSMPNIVYGTYTHITNSMHVYERHYSMIDAIINDPSGNGSYVKIDVPKPTAQEVMEILKSGGKTGSGEYYTWLTSDD